MAQFGIVFGSVAHAQPPPVETVVFNGGLSTVAFGAGLGGAPYGVAVDGSGNVYIIDQTNNRVLKETLSGGSYTQSTVVSGLNGAIALALDTSGNLYIADNGNDRVLKETLSAGSYTQSTVTSSVLANPQGVAVDGNGNVYIADTVNNRVLKETLSAGAYIESTVVSTGLSIPRGLAVDGSGNVYIADADNNRVLKETPSPGNYTQSTIASGDLNRPGSLAVDGSGNVYIADTDNNQVLKETLSAGNYTQSTVLSTGLNSPSGVAVDGNGNIYISNTGSFRVLKLEAPPVNLGAVNVGSGSAISLLFAFSTGGTLGSTTVLTEGVIGLDFFDAGSGSCTAGTAYLTGATCTLNVFLTPRFPGVTLGAGELLDSGGNILATAYIAGTGVAGLAAFSPATASVLTGSGLTPALSGPRRPALDSAGNLYVADRDNNRVDKIAPSGAATVLSTAPITLSGPDGVALDGAGNLYIADQGNARVVMFTPAGTASVLNQNGLTFSSNFGVAVDGAGDVYATDPGNDRVLVFPNGGLAYVLAISGVTPNDAYDVAVDGENNVYIADYTNNRILRVTAGTGSTLSTGSLTLNQPRAIALDPLGDLFVSDSGNNRIVEIPAGSGNATVVSTGSLTLANPVGVAVSSAGKLYIMDTNNNRIVVGIPGVAPSLSFAATLEGSTSSDSPKQVSVLNIGNAALAFPVPLSGTNPSISTNFTLASATTCPRVSASGTAGSLAAGSSCAYAIDFIPAAIGVLNGTLVLRDTSLNAGAAAQSIALSGVGVVPDATQTTVSALPNPAVVTRPTTLTVTVTDTATPATVPTGSVSFTDSMGTTVVSLNGGVAVPLVAGTATLQVTPTVVGVHTITANFVGSAPAPTVRLAPQMANRNFASSKGTATLTVTAIVPTLSFGPIAAQKFGNPPFAVSATSASTGAVTYTVVSGPATIAGNMVSLTGAGTVMLSASQAASGNYAAATATTSFTVAAATGPTVPTLKFAPIPAQTFGNAPFAVSATSASTGAVTYTVVSGPATIAGNMVTLTGSGTVMLSASQAASGNYAAATATTSFTVAAALGFTLTNNSGNGTVLPGGTAAYNMMLAPGSGSTFPHPVALSATGLPPGATVTFQPASILAGSGATPFTMTIQTSNSQTVHSEKPFLGGSLGPMTLAFLLLPVVGIKPLRRRLRKLPGLPMVLFAAALSLGAMVCLSGCGGHGSSNQAAKSYAVVVTATDTVTGAHSTANVTLTVQ